MSLLEDMKLFEAKISTYTKSGLTYIEKVGAKATYVVNVDKDGNGVIVRLDHDTDKEKVVKTVDPADNFDSKDKKAISKLTKDLVKQAQMLMKKETYFAEAVSPFTDDTLAKIAKMTDQNKRSEVRMLIAKTLKDKEMIEVYGLFEKLQKATKGAVPDIFRARTVYDALAIRSAIAKRYGQKAADEVYSRLDN